MKNLCVVGDSFCVFRQDQTDWPRRLSTLLNLNLIGFGLPGESWWFIRQNFLKIVNSEDFDNTELFVFCHTEPHRIIGTFSTLQKFEDGRNDQIRRAYLTQVENKQFNDWACQNWFAELNSMLKGKKVIHLQNFNTTASYFEVLDGIKLDRPTLYEASLSEITDPNKFLRDDRHNHFNDQNNLNLAVFLADLYDQYQDQWPALTQELKLQ